MHGVLVIDKPQGLTSHDVVARVRRAIRESRIGHTGTLDPMATGVLPLVVGRATRLAALLSGASKQYEAGIRLGCATDTYDATGAIEGDAEGRTPAMHPCPAPQGLDEPAVAGALERFRGSYAQQPPKFSAKKVGGVPAHRLARRSREVELSAVPVSVTELVLLDYRDGLAQVRLTASAGFYVRSLAHDLGAALGCGAHLASLRRTRAGSFDLPQAVPLDVVEAEGMESAARLIPLGRLLPDVPAVVLNERGARRASHGNVLSPEDLQTWLSGPLTEAGKVRLLEGSGALLGLAEPRPGGLLQPVVVLV